MKSRLLKKTVSFMQERIAVCGKRFGLMGTIAFFILMCGTKSEAATLYWPVPGHTSLSQGYHDGNAIDISDGSIAGANVVAAIGGKVTHIYLCGTQHYGQTSDCNGFGTGLVIAGDDGRIYQYAHMQANSIPGNVYKGAYVNAGQQIGRVGTTGNSSGNHLHFAISIGNYWNASGINPQNETYQGQTVHTHSYSSSITKQPTCTTTGVRTYTCSCGSSYTETIPAKGHSYKNQVIAPTLTEKGYTLHTCSVCGYSYKDSYVNPPELNSDGWYYSNTLPDGITTDKYTIEYNNYYEKIQANSPGSGWTNAATVKNEWQNSGSQYTSETDLPTSDSRVLVRSVYYHFCGPNAGAAGNYDLTGNYVHYDEIGAASVIPTYCGVDNGHPYYVLDWIDGGGRVWCQSGVTCDGSYGTHGERCKAWYKMNTYQDRVKVVQYKFTKNSGWVATKDVTATSVKVRFKSVESETPKPETPESGTDEDAKGDTENNTENNTDNKHDDNDSITEDGTDDDTDVIESVSLKGISKKIAAGKKIKLSAAIVPADAANQTLTWKSSNSKYATVSSNGLVTTKKKGAGKTVTISAATKDGSDIVATYKIKIVKHAVKSVKITAKSKTVKAGKKLSLKAHVKTTGKTANKTLTWTSSNEKYATVSKKGVVKTTKQGKGKTVKITAKATDGTGKKAVVKIRIK